MLDSARGTKQKFHSHTMNKQRQPSSVDAGTYHSHIILLAVSRVRAGDALCGDGSTGLGGVHSRPEVNKMS